MATGRSQGRRRPVRRGRGARVPRLPGDGDDDRARLTPARVRDHETRPEPAEALVHLAVTTAVSRRPATLSEFPDAFRDDAADTRPGTARQ